MAHGVPGLPQGRFGYRDGMNVEVTRAREALVKRVLEGPGSAGIDARRAAFLNRGVPEAARALVDKVARHAWKVTDADVEAARSAGLSEDEIFELTVCAAIGQATRQLDAALAALDAGIPDGTGSPAAANTEVRS